MTKEENFSGLQVDQDMPFQEKEWTAERAGWIIGLLLLLAGLAGLFGGGPLSRAAPPGRARCAWSTAASCATARRRCSPCRLIPG
ncbi:MAG TPA: hypothetical protein PLV53_06100 [Anaerolineaceae bacterium]|nr:hypothetical protein [Anaerolineaceae bacterium]